jgi:hypothetical protein
MNEETNENLLSELLLSQLSIELNTFCKPQENLFSKTHWRDPATIIGVAQYINLPWSPLIEHTKM